MLDLETAGNGSRAAIVSIGAVIFDPQTGELGSSFYRAIKLQSSMHFGDVDASTIEWWMRQDDKARAVFNDENRVSLKDALLDFANWVQESTSFHQRILWGNGSNFDNVILSNAYDAANMTKPWPYYGDRDVRTMVDIGRRVLGIDPKKTVNMDGIAHNALHDAKHQVLYVSEIYKHIQPIQQQDAA